MKHSRVETCECFYDLVGCSDEAGGAETAQSVDSEIPDLVAYIASSYVRLMYISYLWSNCSKSITPDI